MSELESVIRRLEELDHRVTPSRVAVIAAVLSHSGHFTVDDVVRQARRGGRARGGARAGPARPRPAFAPPRGGAPRAETAAPAVTRAAAFSAVFVLAALLAACGGKSSSKA